MAWPRPLTRVSLAESASSGTRGAIRNELSRILRDSPLASMAKEVYCCVSQPAPLPSCPWLFVHALSQVGLVDAAAPRAGEDGVGGRGAAKGRVLGLLTMCCAEPAAAVPAGAAAVATASPSTPRKVSALPSQS